MEFLISFYDNALIYYPNIFFTILFFVSILGITLVAIMVVILGKVIWKFIKAIKDNLKQKRIKEGRGTCIIHLVRFLTASLVCIIKIILVQINKALGYIESQIEKITKKIKKEIFIKEQ